MLIGSAALMAPHIASGMLRPLLHFGPLRLPDLAQTATAAE